MAPRGPPWPPRGRIRPNSGRGHENIFDTLQCITVAAKCTLNAQGSTLTDVATTTNMVVKCSVAGGVILYVLLLNLLHSKLYFNYLTFTVSICLSGMHSLVK